MRFERFLLRRVRLTFCFTPRRVLNFFFRIPPTGVRKVSEPLSLAAFFAAASAAAFSLSVFLSWAAFSLSACLNWAAFSLAALASTLFVAASAFFVAASAAAFSLAV